MPDEPREAFARLGLPRAGGPMVRPQEAINVRICDRHGLRRAGRLPPRPRPPTAAGPVVFSAKNTPPNIIPRWDYFEGLEKNPKRKNALAPSGSRARAMPKARITVGAGSGDGSRSADEMRALEVLGLGIRRRFSSPSRKALSRPGQGSAPRCETRRCRGGKSSFS